MEFAPFSIPHSYQIPLFAFVEFLHSLRCQLFNIFNFFYAKTARLRIYGGKICFSRQREFNFTRRRQISPYSSFKRSECSIHTVEERKQREKEEKSVKYNIVDSFVDERTYANLLRKMAKRNFVLRYGCTCDFSVPVGYRDCIRSRARYQIK